MRRNDSGKMCEVLAARAAKMGSRVGSAECPSDQSWGGGRFGRRRQVMTFSDLRPVVSKRLQRVASTMMEARAEAVLAGEVVRKMERREWKGRWRHGLRAS